MTRRWTCLIPTILVLTLLPASSFAQCGGPFETFVDGLSAEAIAKGHDAGTVERFFSGAAQDVAVLKADRSQGIFQSGFIQFSRKLISADRIAKGQDNAQRWKSQFDRVEEDYGVDRSVLLAFWAFETDYGAFQGNYNTLNALVTLAHDCRRPELFRPQVFAALELFERGGFDPAATTGAWAGEIGMVQMLPGDILSRGVDGDGDGQVMLKSSVPDALLSGANMLSGFGWRAGEPWIEEVIVPDTLDWSLTGTGKPRKRDAWASMGVAPRDGTWDADLPASLLLPQGRKGPAFLAYPNFDVFFEWNQSFTYVMTAAYFATRLAGAPIYRAGEPDPALSQGDMIALQTALAARGYDVGDIDGILGAKTRIAVQDVQTKLGLPADAWPTQELIDRL